MDLTNPKQIEALLQRHSFRFSKAFGQNFLINPRIPRKIAEAAGVDEETTVLEIGPGIGCLTEQLAERAKKVIAVEIDQRLLPLLDETLTGRNNVQIVCADVLSADLKALLAGEERLAVCANLPYNITTPILTRLFTCGVPFRSVTVMVQKEVAKRFCARKGSKDYGAITLFLNYYTKPAYLFDVSAGNFLPRPHVDSAVIRFDAVPPPVDTEPEQLFRLIRAAFGQRRKTLTNAWTSLGIPKERTADALRRIGKPETARGEELDLTDYASLATLLEGDFPLQ